MANKNNDGEGAGKSKKRTVTPGTKHIIKSKQTKSTASLKSTATPKQTPLPSSRKVAGDKPQKDKDIKFVVYGQVLYADKKPAIEVEVKAFDQDIAGEDFLGETTTDQDGNYKITYSESQFRRTEKEIGGPDLIVRVYSAEGKVMAQSKRKRNAKQEETVDLTVGNEQQFVVSGTIYGSDNRPRAGALVRAYDQDLRKKQLLGKAVTDAAGHYSIAYTSRKFLRAEKTSADLYVVVVDVQRKELVSSEVLFNAPSEVAIDLTLPPDGQTLSEFEILLADILPLLTGQGKDDADLKIAELEEKDIAFLSRESGQPQERIAFLLAAVKAALAAPLEKPGDQVLLTAVEYPGGHLDWYSFDERTDQKLNRDVTIKQKIFNLATIPTALSFRGMPAPNLWEFEGAQVRFGSIQAAPTDLARLLPTDLLLQRAGQVPDGLHEQLAQVQPLFAKNPEAFSQPFEGLELEGLPASELPAFREIHARLSRLANLHPGLELHELLAKDLSPTKKAREVERRIGLTQKIFQMNPDLDFLSIDFYPDSEDLKGVKLDGLGEDEQRMVFADLRAYQRVCNIADHAQDARLMLEAGYDSAFAVASANIETLTFETGLPLIEAVRVRGAAKAALASPSSSGVKFKRYVSKAQNDAGEFEFSFRDGRYNPFEGAGAISSWKLSLPKNFRSFDYQTIGDVILHIDYTTEDAGEGSSFRQIVEATTSATLGALLNYFSNKPLFRVFSLRHEFPNEFHRLLHSPINTEISIKLSEKFFPIFSLGRTMQISLAKLALGTPKNQTVSNFKISINNSERTSFTSDPLLGGLPTNQNLETLFVAGNKTELKFKLKNAGNLAPTPPVVGDSSPISPDKLLDMLIYLEYKITS